MFQEFLSALSLEMLQFLKKHPDFFDQNQSAREDLLKNFKAPTVFKQYLSSVEGDAFTADLKLVFQVINGGDSSQMNLKKSSFFNAMVKFFVESFASKLDALGSNFYLLPYEERKKKAEQLIESDSHTAKAIKDLLVTNSYQELTEGFEQLSKSVGDASTIVVQSPRDMTSDLKKEMRDHFAKDHPLSFPSFQINRQLIGGLRVFIDGKSHDLSWFSQVQKLTSLKN